MLRRFAPSATMMAASSGAAATTALRFASLRKGVSSGYSEAVGDIKNIPLLDQLVGYYVNVQARKMYYKDFLRVEHQAVRWAFADVRKNSEALAHGLLETGVRPGQRVLAIQPCNVETFVLQLACAKIGALCCIVPHTKISADRLRYYLNEFQPNHLIAREWLVVPEQKGGETIERNIHFWDMIYNVIPELGMSYPGQRFQWVHSQEFHFLKKVIITDHNVNLLGVTPMRKLLVWGPFSYYEQRLRTVSALLHPDDPILSLEDGSPAAEDKPHVVFSHRNCNNAGYIFSKLMGLGAESRFAVMPNHHTNPIGAIIAPFAALTSGAVLVHLGDNMFTDEHAITAIEKLSTEEVSGILGKKGDFDLLLKHGGNFDDDQYENLKWVALFESATEEPISDGYIKKLKDVLQLEEVYIFRGPIETAYLTSYRTSAGPQGLVPHTEAKVVGDRGTTDAKTLAAGTRGNLKLKGPHVTASYYNNAGLLSEMVDEKGFCSTSRDATMDASGNIKVMEAQTY